MWAGKAAEFRRRKGGGAAHIKRGGGVYHYSQTGHYNLSKCNIKTINRRKD